MTTDFAWWSAAVAGNKAPVHEEPECGYFKIRDRRGANKQLAPIKRPWVACAIWRNDAGQLQAELAGTPVAVERIWPWCARHPIPYDHYQFWHAHEHFPEEIAA